MVPRGGPIHASLLLAVVLISLAGMILRATALVGLAAAWTVLFLASRARALAQARVLGASRVVPSTGTSRTLPLILSFATASSFEFLRGLRAWRLVLAGRCAEVRLRKLSAVC